MKQRPPGLPTSARCSLLLALWTAPGTCGMLLPADARAPVLTPVYLSVHVAASAQGEEFVLEGTFSRRDLRRTEYRYVLPLPREAVPREAAVTIGGQTIATHLLQPAAATSAAEQWVRQYRNPAFLHWFGRPLVVSAPFPVPREVEHALEVTYVAEHHRDSKLHRLSIPLRPLRGLAGSLTAPAVRVDLTGERTPDLVYSPTHTTKTRQPERSSPVVTMEPVAGSDTTEAVLYYGDSGDPLHVEGLVYAPGSQEDPYLLLLIGGKEESTPAREILFILDISGSMRGAKVAYAKEALTYCLDDLAPEDRFDLGLYNHGNRLLTPRCVPCTAENLAQGKAFYQPERGKGMTDIEEALTAGLQVFSPDDRPKVVVVLTDGFATAGITEDERIIEATLAANRAQARFFTVGVGADYNRYLLEELARRTGGHHVHVSAYEELLRLLRDSWEKVAWGLWNLEVVPEDFEAYAMLPDPLPELVTEPPRIVVGRMRGVQSGRVTVRASTPEGPATQRVGLAPTLHNPLNAWVARLWANRQLALEQESIWRFGFEDERAEAIRRLSTRYALPTELSLALRQAPTPEVRDKAVDRWNQAHEVEVRRALELRVLAHHQILLDLAALARNPENEARYHSRRNWPLAYHEQSGRPRDARNARFIAGRAFEQNGRAWVDAMARGRGPARPLLTFSPEYFALARSDWRLAEMLSLGPNVVVNLPTGPLETRLSRS